VDEAAPATAAGRSALLELQRALSPTLPAVDGLPLSARYLPGKDAGQLPGDWYDAIALDGGDVALVVGNVAGGDLVAAALMCQLRSAVRAYAMEGHPPSVVVGRANEFHLGLGADRQARLAYALVHPADRIVTLVRAGHVPPMLAGGESAPCFLDGAGGPPLGVQPGEVWRETTVQLPAGSALVLYTDGLLGDDESVEDGMARLIDAVKGGRTDSAAALMDALVALVGDSAPTETAVLIGHLATAATGPPAELRRTLPPTAESATVARWLVTDLLRDAADPDALDTAALLTTELVSNAIRHTGDELTLTVRLEAGMLRVGVSDTSHRRPQLVQAGTRDTSGRGLHLVEALADRWGVDPDGRGLGKTVWFELAAPPV
jgi:anti-sigma regulatory factor (Ser/Thr protein kinase)